MIAIALGSGLHDPIKATEALLSLPPSWEDRLDLERRGARNLCNGFIVGPRPPRAQRTAAVVLGVITAEVEQPQATKPATEATRRWRQ